MPETIRLEDSPQERLSFVSTGEAATVGKDPAARRAWAAEHTAVYLDWIEGHIDRIARALDAGPANSALISELQSIRNVLTATGDIAVETLLATKPRLPPSRQHS